MAEQWFYAAGGASDVPTISLLPALLTGVTEETGKALAEVEEARRTAAAA